MSINNLPFSYRIRRSHRARRARIVVSPEKIEVVVPLLMTERSAHTFIAANRQWVARTLEKMTANLGAIDRLAPEHYTEGALIPFRGGRWALKLQASKLKRLKIEFDEGFIAHLPDALADKTHGEAIRDALIGWMKKSVKAEAERFVDLHAHKFRLYPRSITVRKQKSRWGSCGIHNDINLNWVLMLASPEILEYVVVHEICHIRFRDHSSDFWSLVEAHLPDYKKRRAWLKKNGAQLMAGL
ncbi:MAG: M48 family metallopeptidase [Gammaproteobacteria bacterium]